MALLQSALVGLIMLWGPVNVDSNPPILEGLTSQSIEQTRTEKQQANPMHKQDLRNNKSIH